MTAVELLPVHAFAQDRFLVEKGLRNYWGYSTLAFFAPEPRYLVEPSMRNELKVAVRRLHAAGIEVLLDVVYNHTCEGSEMGPTLSWRGLDNASYYRLVPGDERRHINDTGTGNTLNISHPRVLQMVMDSLRHWVDEYHVDGFRFDLGTILGREDGGFDPGSGFFDAARQDPVLSRVKLISEPWDIGPGGYQVGNHPPGFAEWNDKYRDAVRRFWRGDPGARPELAARLTGSAELFDRRRRRPWASVNYVASHDGFTLHDLVSYREKHNEANGEGNRDGHGENYTSNWGEEGETADPAVAATRAGLKRAMLATVLASAGGRKHALRCTVAARQEFAGYWEYMLDEAIFTANSRKFQDETGVEVRIDYVNWPDMPVRKASSRAGPNQCMGITTELFRRLTTRIIAACSIV